MAYETAKPTAHLENPELVTPGPWALSYTRGSDGCYSVGICVANPKYPTVANGNCFLTVGLGGPGAVNGSRQAVEATAAYVASLPTRVAELEAEATSLKGASDESFQHAYTSLVGAFLKYVERPNEQMNEPFIRTRGGKDAQWTRSQFAQALRAGEPIAFSEMVSLMVTAAYLIRKDKDFPAEVEKPVAEWMEVKSVLHPNSLPTKDEKVLLRLKSGNFAVGQMTWAARWLLQGGGVLLLQDVTHWRKLPPGPESII